MILIVVGQRGRGGIVGAAGDMAPGIVAGGVALPAFAGAGAAAGIQAGQLMGLAIAVEVLVRRAAAVERALPRLTQMRTKVASAVALC